MATIDPITLTITRIPNTDLVRFNVFYSVRASNHDKATEMSYHLFSRVIGDDTPGDGTDDLIGTMEDVTITFSETNPGHARGFGLVLPLSLFDEDRGGVLPQADEIRVVVTITPILPSPSSRESNQVTISTTGVLSQD